MSPWVFDIDAAVSTALDDLADAIPSAREELMARKSCKHETWGTVDGGHMCLGCGFQVCRAAAAA